MKCIKVKRVEETDKQIRDYIYNITKNMRSYNKPNRKAVEEFIRNKPKIGEVITLENAQYHFRDSGIFAGWSSWKYGNTFCYDISSDGVVTLGQVQSIGHSH